MIALNPAEKEELLRALEELPPEAVSEVREFIEFKKFKAQAGAQADAVAIGGLLQGYRFSDGAIDEARREMWARFHDNPA
jgi:hypothetical protein